MEGRLMCHEFLFHLLATKNKNNKEKGKRKVKYQLSEHACSLLKLKKNSIKGAVEKKIRFFKKVRYKGAVKK